MDEFVTAFIVAPAAVVPYVPGADNSPANFSNFSIFKLGCK